MVAWGDVNAVLNRLVGEGVIQGFRTNLRDPSRAFGLHVIVSPPETLDASGVEPLRRRVVEELTPLVADVTVTIDRTAAQT